MSAASVITIGNFDGVHVGHAALVRRARDLAAAHRAGARVVAMAFDPHPLSRLRPAVCPPRLTTFERRSALLREAGADEVLRLVPDDTTLQLSPEQFIERVVRERSPVAFVEGSTFRFGHDRAGDVQSLGELGRRFGFKVEVLAPVDVVLSDSTVAAATSTLARWLVEHGRVRDAALVLGRPYAMDGEVVRGDRVGRTLGFPTANLKSECLAPGDGVYAGVAAVEGGRRSPAAISVGSKPTFGGSDRVVEAYLLDAETQRPATAGELRDDETGATAPEYGWTMRLEFVGWVRDQVRFASADALGAQIDRDCRRVREMLALASPEEAIACR